MLYENWGLHLRVTQREFCCYFCVIVFYFFSLWTSLSIHSTWDLSVLIQLERISSTWEFNECCGYWRLTWEVIALIQLEGIFSIWEFNGSCEYLRVTWELIDLIQLKGYFFYLRVQRMLWVYLRFTWELMFFFMFYVALKLGMFEGIK